MSGILCQAYAQQHETKHTYDALGRLKQTDYDTSKTQKYKYDAAGNRRQVAISAYDAPGNDSPIAVLDLRDINEDGSISFNPTSNDSDPEGDTLSLSSVAVASNGTATKSGNQVQYSPNANWNGEDSFTYVVSDGTSTDTGTITITVNPVNDAPNAINDSTTTNEDTVKTFDPRSNDTDVDNSLSELLITQVTQGSNGSVTKTSDSKRVTYNPDSNHF